MLTSSREHLIEAGETYFQHMRFAFIVGALAVGAGLACIVHSVVPALCPKSCSRTVGLLQTLFADRHKLVGGDLLVNFVGSAGPENVYNRLLLRTQPEVEPRIVAGVVARLAENGLRLDLGAVMHQYARPNCAAIRLHTLQLDLQPVLVGLHVIPQQRWRLVHIHDQHIHIAVIIEVAERAAPAAVRRRTKIRRHAARLRYSRRTPPCARPTDPECARASPAR